MLEPPVPVPVPELELELELLELLDEPTLAGLPEESLAARESVR